MKRHMDLVRDILLKFEERPGTFVRTMKEIQIENYKPDEIKGHIWLMMDAGLIVKPTRCLRKVRKARLTRSNRQQDN